MDGEKLIEGVREFPCLWMVSADLSAISYFDTIFFLSSDTVFPVNYSIAISLVVQEINFVVQD